MNVQKIYLNVILVVTMTLLVYPIVIDKYWNVKNVSFVVFLPSFIILFKIVLASLALALMDVSDVRILYALVG